MRPLSSDLRSRIVAAIESGATIDSVAERFAVSRNTVCRILKRYREQGTIEPLPHGGGREPYLRPDDFETLRLLVERDNDATLEQLRERGGWDCSLTTIWRALEVLKLTLKVKDLRPSEQDTPKVQAQREEHCRTMKQYGAARLIFLDEAGVNTGMTPRRARAPRGQRARGSAPGHWRSSTIVAAIGLGGVLAPLEIGGAMDGATFKEYVAKVLVPELKAGDVVVMDNLKAHKVEGVEEAIRGAGAELVYQPPYSPDLNPIEKMWSKVKGIMRRIGARTREGVTRALGEALRDVTLADIHGWFRFVGLSPMLP